MDAAGPQEVDVPYDPLDVVEHVLNAENLPFDRTDDGDLAFALAGPGSDADALQRMTQKYPTSAIAVLTTQLPWAQLELGGSTLVDFHVPR